MTKGGKGSGFSYQGVGSVSGRATNIGGNIYSVKDEIKESFEKYPKVVSQRAKNVIDNVSSEKSQITVYRAAPADTINPNDWVFLDRAEAERWSKSMIGKKTKIGKNGKPFKVLAVDTTAKNVGWTGKGDHFVYLGKKMRG